MFLEESLWIRSQFYCMNLKPNSTVLDIGSASLEYRIKVQPYIEQNVFEPLKSIKCRIFHLDSKEFDGVDIVCEVNDLSNIRDQYDLIFCTNLLEHIYDRNKLAKDISKLLQKDGHLIVTVPYELNYHPDPIDTLYRPTPNDLKRLFSSLEMVNSEILEVPSAIYHYNRLRAFFLRKKVFKVTCAVFKNVIS